MVLERTAYTFVPEDFEQAFNTLEIAANRSSAFRGVPISRCVCFTWA